MKGSVWICLDNRNTRVDRTDVSWVQQTREELKSFSSRPMELLVIGREVILPAGCLALCSAEI